MSRTKKDADLDAGRAPHTIYVGFKPDPLNESEVYYVCETFLYKQDAEADFDGPVYEYQLVRVAISNCIPCPECGGEVGEHYVNFGKVCSLDPTF